MHVPYNDYEVYISSEKSLIIYIFIISYWIDGKLFEGIDFILFFL